MENFSNRLIVVVFAGNYSEYGKSWTKNEANTVISYHYDCGRARNAWGKPYGLSHSSYLEFWVRNFSEKFEKDLLRQIHTTEACDYSLLFNVEFDSNQRISHFDDCLIVRGYPVDIQEEYYTGADNNNLEGQRIIKVKILLTSINFDAETNKGLILQISNA